jgi:BirA family biotin operon repressor/biotin-[acetyl-CoA-carboxylase] ligase
MSLQPAAEFEARLRDLLPGRSLDWFETVGSTNELALDAASQGAAHGHVVGAESQTRGRGRMGRVWLSERGQALTFSVVLHCESVEPSRLALGTFAGSIAVSTALRELGLEGAHIKWPNDVLVGHAKIAGILSETRTESDVRFVVMGLGINVNQTLDSIPEGGTSCLVETHKTWSRSRLLVYCLERLDQEWQRLGSGDARGLLNRWRELSPWHQGERVRLQLDDEMLLGETAGVRDDGALQVITDDGRHISVTSGTVSYIRRED